MAMRSALMAMALLNSSMSLDGDAQYSPFTRRIKTSRKAPKTKKVLGNRAKNKVAAKSRKRNRK